MMNRERAHQPSERSADLSTVSIWTDSAFEQLLTSDRLTNRIQRSSRLESCLIESNGEIKSASGIVWENLFQMETVGRISWSTARRREITDFDSLISIHWFRLTDFKLAKLATRNERLELDRELDRPASSAGDKAKTIWEKRGKLIYLDKLNLMG